MSSSSSGAKYYLYTYFIPLALIFINVDSGWTQFYKDISPIILNDFIIDSISIINVESDIGNLTIDRTNCENLIDFKIINNEFIKFKLGIPDSNNQNILNIDFDQQVTPFFDIKDLSSLIVGETSTITLSIKGHNSSSNFKPLIAYYNPADKLKIKQTDKFKFKIGSSKIIGIYFLDPITSLQIEMNSSSANGTTFSFSLGNIFDMASQNYINNPDLAESCSNKIWVGIDLSSSVDSLEISSIIDFLMQFYEGNKSNEDLINSTSLAYFSARAKIVLENIIISDSTLAPGGTIYNGLHTLDTIPKTLSNLTNWSSVFNEILPNVQANDLVLVITDGFSNTDNTSKISGHFSISNIKNLLQSANYIKQKGAHLLIIGGNEFLQPNSSFFIEKCTDFDESEIAINNATSQVTANQLDGLILTNFHTLPTILLNIYNPCANNQSLGSINYNEIASEIKPFPIIYEYDENISYDITTAPNPTSQYLSIIVKSSIQQEIIIVEILSSIGETIKKIKMESNSQYIIDIHSLISNMYYLKFHNSKGQTIAYSSFIVQ